MKTRTNILLHSLDNDPICPTAHGIFRLLLFNGLMYDLSVPTAHPSVRMFSFSRQRKRRLAHTSKSLSGGFEIAGLRVESLGQT